MQATADTWVTTDRETNTHRAVRVVDMEDSHLWRWINYFRRKYQSRHRDFATDTRKLDDFIMRTFVTGPAIYAEAARRGLPVTYESPPQRVAVTWATDERLQATAKTGETTTATVRKIPRADGRRRIDLEDGD